MVHVAVEGVLLVESEESVLQGVFDRGYLVLLEGLIWQWGIPLALYSDRHAAFKYNARQVPVLAESTQFAKVIRELGIQQIFALSPQANLLPDNFFLLGTRGRVSASVGGPAHPLSPSTGPGIGAPT